MMKKLILILSLALALGLSGFQASAQESPRWDINVSAAYPGYMTFSDAGEGMGYAFGQVFAVIFTFGLYKPHNQFERVENHYIPPIALQAGYQVLPWLQVGGDVFYHYGWKNGFTKEADPQPSLKRKSHSIALLPGVKFTYYNKKWFHIYSSLYIGGGFNYIHSEKLVTNEEDGTSHYEPEDKPRGRFALQTTPVGFAFGNAFYGFLDMGLGTEYNGFRVGMGYKF